MKIAAAQIDVIYGEHQQNVDRMIAFANQARQQQAELVVFPECSLSGYCCRNAAEAFALARPLQNEYLAQLQHYASAHGVYLICGLLESDAERVFNTIVLLGPAGIVSTYRKTHLPYLGVDRFTSPGDCPYQLSEVAGVNIGLLICYDCSFPEPSRILALHGADLIVLPTNWPSGAKITADLIPPARAMENHVYFAAANRVGTERGFEFIGKSRICHPSGTNLAFADHANEEILYADVDAELARQKKMIRVPGEHEINLIADRRPDLYRPLSTRPESTTS